ncbi:hypothetical protein AWB94_00895 [Mycolicibacterium canariasense]|nr:hypothetical protein AWB94_00895 [Mycolicibacterium canariasense]
MMRTAFGFVCLVGMWMFPLAACIPPAHAGPYEDIGFLMVLDRNHIAYTSASDAIEVGHTICEALLSGLSRRDVVAAAASAADKLPLSLVGVLVDAAVEAYCPETMKVGGRGA